MRLAKLDEALDNMKLATAIKSRDGKKLINQGATLSSRVIQRLIGSGLNTVYIEDDNIDVKLQETLDSDQRAILYTKMQDVFAGIVKNEFNSLEFSRFIRTELIPEIKDEPVSIPADEAVDQEDIIQHSINVATLAVKTARSMGFNMDKIETMAFVALLHDMGKVLQKKDPRFSEIPHYELAFDFLKKKNCSVITYMSIRFQDEAYNGSGKYKVSADKQIDLSKILSICDYYENLKRTTNLMPYECFEKTQALVNTRFDPEVFEAFRDSIYIYPVGLPVQLNNKAEGIIVKQNESYPLRPVIKVFDKYYNLMENLSLFIEKVVI